MRKRSLIPAGDKTADEDQQARSADGDQKPGERPGVAGADSRPVREPTAEHRACDADDDVAQQAALAMHDLAGDPANQCAENQPSDKMKHVKPVPLRISVCRAASRITAYI